MGISKNWVNEKMKTKQVQFLGFKFICTPKSRGLEASRPMS